MKEDSSISVQCMITTNKKQFNRFQATTLTNNVVIAFVKLRQK